MFMRAPIDTVLDLTRDPVASDQTIRDGSAGASRSFACVYRSRATLSLARLAQLGVASERASAGQTMPGFRPIQMPELGWAMGPRGEAATRPLALQRQMVPLHHGALRTAPPRGAEADRVRRDERATPATPAHRADGAPLRFTIRTDDAILHCRLERGRAHVTFRSTPRWTR